MCLRDISFPALPDILSGATFGWPSAFQGSGFVSLRESAAAMRPLRSVGRLRSPRLPIEIQTKIAPSRGFIIYERNDRSERR
jgi:hypothetical protein